MTAFFRRLGAFSIGVMVGCGYAGFLAGVGVPTVERLRDQAIGHISGAFVPDLIVGRALVGAPD